MFVRRQLFACAAVAALFASTLPALAADDTKVAPAWPQGAPAARPRQAMTARRRRPARRALTACRPLPLLTAEETPCTMMLHMKRR